MVNDETLNEWGSNSKITAIFQTQTLPFNNGNYRYCHYYCLNKYRSVGNAHTWFQVSLPFIQPLGISYQYYPKLKNLTQPYPS
jgi:hypothetical protein